VPRYYTYKNTDEIIGYKYEVKRFTWFTIVKDMKEKKLGYISLNAYGRNVEMTIQSS
jgi:hypothetical protein